jgi:hypothetical protein
MTIKYMKEHHLSENIFFYFFMNPSLPTTSKEVSSWTQDQENFIYSSTKNKWEHNKMEEEGRRIQSTWIYWNGRVLYTPGAYSW